MPMSGADGCDEGAVDLGGYRDGAVSEGVGAVFDRDAGCGEQARGGVAEHVRVQVDDAGSVGGAVVGLADVRRVSERADLGGEDEVVRVLPRPSGRGGVGRLHRALPGHGGHDRGWDLQVRQLMNVLGGNEPVRTICRDQGVAG